MGKTRDLFKKLKIPREFSCKDGHKKDRNGMDLTETEYIKKGGKNTQKKYTKNILLIQIIMMVLSLT